MIQNAPQRCALRAKENGCCRNRAPARVCVKTHTFLLHRKVRPIKQKPSGQDRTAAERNHVAKATRRRRRILQGRILCSMRSPCKGSMPQKRRMGRAASRGRWPFPTRLHMGTPRKMSAKADGCPARRVKGKSSLLNFTRETLRVHKNVLSESLQHLLLWLIFRHMHLNLTNVRSTYAS